MLNNLSGGLVNMASSESITNYSGTTGIAINNEAGATFESSSATGNSVNSVPFNTQGGVIEVASGTLALTSGLSGAGATTTFNVAQGAAVNISGGGSGYSGTLTGTGGGTVSLVGGTLSIGSAGATFDFPSGMFQWSGGTIAGSATSSPYVLNNTDTITVTGSATKYLWYGLTLNNSGTIVDDGTGAWQFYYYAMLNNLSGGLVNMASSESITNYSGTTGIAINNEAGATFESSTTSGNSVVNSVPFINQGGMFYVPTGATLVFASSETFTGTVTGMGGGNLNLAGGTLSIGSAGATFDFPSGMFQWSGGTIEGSGSSSPYVLNNTGTITLTGSATKYLWYGLTLNNSGTIVDDGTGAWQFYYYAMLNNLSGGLVNMASSESITNYSGTTGIAINNEAGATFESSSTAGNAVNSVPFNTQGGAIEVANGTLALTSGLSGAGATTFNVAQGAAVNISGGGSGYSGTLTGTGGGTVSLVGGTLSIGSAGATFDFPSGMFQWSGGTIEGSGSSSPYVLNNTGTITLTGSATKYLWYGLTLNNSGTIVDDGTGAWVFYYYAVLNNLSGGLVNMASSESITITPAQRESPSITRPGRPSRAAALLAIPSTASHSTTLARCKSRPEPSR